MENMISTEPKAALIGYRWIAVLDELQEKRVSDWDHAEHCSECDRKIVHVYTVQNPDKSEVIVGRECAHKLLGLSKGGPAVKTALRLAEGISAARAREARHIQSTAARFASRTADEARTEGEQRNNWRIPGKDFVIFHKDKVGFYALWAPRAEPVVTPTARNPISGREALEENGWSEVK